MAASWRGTTKGGGRYIVAREAGTGPLMSRGRGRLSFACRCNEPPFLLQKSKALRKNDKFLSLTTVSCTSLALLRVVRDKPHTAFANRWNGWKIIVSLDPFDFFLSTGLDYFRKRSKRILNVVVKFIVYAFQDASPLLRVCDL